MPSSATTTAAEPGPTHQASQLEIKGLRVWFEVDEGALKAVDGVSLSIAEGQTAALIGESGSGKSVTARSLLRIVPPPGRIVAGDIFWRPRGGPVVNVARLNPRGKAIRAIRGGQIAMVFQEPMTSLSPVHTIGNQIIEGIRLHRRLDKPAARALAVDMLAQVGIADPSRRIDDYPHQLSGGMRQRAMIAMALACNPALLVADEPTTALDVTVQAQILALLRNLQATYGMAVLYITHDLAVVAEVAETVHVMYLGRIVERAHRRDLFCRPLHPYTQGLLQSVPTLTQRRSRRLEAIPGAVPPPLNPPWRCAFWERCPRRMPGRCDRHMPALVEVEPGRTVRCFLHHREVERA